MNDADSVPVNLQNLAGTWRRRSLRRPDGSEDVTTQVFWIQAAAEYADVRIPIDRPSFDGCRSLADCSSAQLRWLATQQGFAGRLVHRFDGAFHWNREIDFQPPGGKPDVGRLRYADSSGAVMIEDGVEAPYTEVWERSLEAQLEEEPPIVLPFPDRPGGRGIVVAAGGFFLIAIDRRPHLSTASSLTALLDQMPAGASASRYLDMELSLGRRDPDPARWVVTASTLPWREGEWAFAHEAELEKQLRAARD